MKDLWELGTKENIARECSVNILPRVSIKGSSSKRFGSIPNIEVGTWWETREACSNDSIHACVATSHLVTHVDIVSRPWVAGISGGPEGAYSVALSGGYDDDVDLGYALLGSISYLLLWFLLIAISTYTGSGIFMAPTFYAAPQCLFFQVDATSKGQKRRQRM